MKKIVLAILMTAAGVATPAFADSALTAPAATVPAAQAYAQYDYYRFGLGTYDANVRVDGNGLTTLAVESSRQLGVPYVSTVVDPTGFVNLRGEAVSATGYHADGNGQLTYSLRVFRDRADPLDS